MNKFVKSAIAIGVGVAAYNMVRKNDLLSSRNVRKMQKRIARAMS